MAEITSAELRRALVAAGGWHRAATVADLAETAVATLHELIPADGVGWNEVDLRASRVYAVTSPPEYLELDRVETLNRLIGQHPIVRYVEATGDGSAMKISDFVTQREFHGLEIYTDFFRPLGAEDLMAVVFQSQPVIVGIAFTRHRRSYTEGERALLNLLRPHLATAYGNVTARTEGRRRLDLLERALDGRNVVPLMPDGRLAHGSPLLEEWFGSTPATLLPGVYEREDARLVVRRVDGDPPLLLLDERRFTPDPKRVRELALSEREGQVVALAGRGLTDAQIARELFLSGRTVAKHLQRAYDKLGVHDRAAAAAKLLGR